MPAPTTTSTYSGYLGYLHASDSMIFGAGATERMRIDSAGNVGIGVTPSAWSGVSVLQIQNAALSGFSNSTYIGQNWYSDGTNRYIGASTYALIYEQNKSSGAHIWYNAPNTGTAGGAATFSERMRIDSSGRLLIGTTSPINNSYKISVSNGNSGSIVANSTGAGDANFYSTSTAIGYHFYAESTTAKFYVENNGTIYSTNTSVQAISDIRHKENIKTLETGLKEVLSLQPRRFDWKNGCGTGEKNVAGFIAQEVEPILPDLIGSWKNDMESTESFKSLAMGNIIPTLVKAIQELNAKVDAQALEIAQLKGN